MLKFTDANAREACESIKDVLEAGIPCIVLLSHVDVYLETVLSEQIPNTPEDDDDDDFVDDLDTNYTNDPREDPICIKTAIKSVHERCTSSLFCLY